MDKPEDEKEMEDISPPTEVVDEGLDLTQETPPEDVFIAPSIYKSNLLAGESYTHQSAIPVAIAKEPATECVLGVDEAGRGPVLGPMVYGVFYLAKHLEQPLLSETHHFDDSKVLTPATRSSLMQSLCTPDTDLHQSCGWATRVMSARDISAGMLKPHGTYNLNAQAMDATIGLIQGVLDLGINVREVYIDTIGNPSVYQKKLERIFPSMQVTVAKKADSLYPCVSAASICAKVTRDAALEVCYEAYRAERINNEFSSLSSLPDSGWGSGYPSDARSVSWLKQNMNPLFGWGPECRFSWGTAKDMLEASNVRPRVDWPDPDEFDAEDSMKVTQFFNFAYQDGKEVSKDGPINFFGTSVGENVF